MRIEEVPQEATPEEKYYIEQLRILQEAYQKQAEPIINRICSIRSRRTSTYIAIPEPGDGKKIEEYFVGISK